MLVVITPLLVLLCMIGAGWCRVAWGGLSWRKKTLSVFAASSSVTIYTFSVLTGWHFTSTLADEIMGALAVGGYSLLITLLTLFRPKPLTQSVGALLLLPV